MTYNVFGGTLNIAQSINLHSRKHSKSLIDKTTALNDRHFLIRALYEDCY